MTARSAQSTLIAFALALPMAFGAAFAADVGHHDKQWLKNAHQVSLAAIKASKAAKKQGESAEVNKIANKIIADDQVLDKKVKTLAKDLNVSLPNSPSAKMKSELQTVKAKSGTEFDKLWTRTMLKTELKTANETQDEVAKGQSHKVMTLAKTALPAINLEVNMLQHAMAKLKTPHTTSVSK